MQKETIMEIQKITKSSISDQVYDQLKKHIIEGIWAQGEKLPSENDLAKSFGVSRITIRQALSKLTTLGILETRTGEGSFVKELTPGIYVNEIIPYVYLGKDSMREVFEFRMIIEVGSAEMAAYKMTEEELLALEESVDRLESYSEDLDKYVEEDLEFHTIIAESTRNSLIMQMNSIVRDVMRETISSLTEKVGMGIGKKYHRLLLEALKERDGELAKELMKEHLLEAYGTYSQN